LLRHPVEPTTTAWDSRPELGRIQGGSQGSILNFHILVQCKYVFLLNFEALLCARVNIVLSEMSAPKNMVVSGVRQWVVI
jgi:hypothetical protein